MRRMIAAAASLLLTVSLAPMAAAQQPFPDVIPLPDGFAPEGIAVGKGSTFYVGSLANGAIYRGDLRTGEGEVVVPNSGGPAVGIEVDAKGRVWVAGGPAGTGTIYDGDTGAILANYQFTAPGASFVNDVVVTRDAAYFTDSNPMQPNGAQPQLFKVEISAATGPSATFETLPVDAPNIAFPNLNGIETTPDGSALILAHASNAALYRYDPDSGDTTLVDLGGASLPNGDGLIRRGITLYVVQNFLNQVSALTLSPDGTSATIAKSYTSGDFDIPTTAGLFGSGLYAVNARFSTPTATTFDVVRVDLHP